MYIHGLHIRTCTWNTHYVCTSMYICMYMEFIIHSHCWWRMSNILEKKHTQKYNDVSMYVHMYVGMHMYVCTMYMYVCMYVHVRR